ncbi:hypothetical protein BC835DRAFT_1385046 [Cytidiella melzeri]|nr:hypothetical protein BC835DRAFT_1385046 [Cytidiella melzeri]
MQFFNIFILASATSVFYTVAVSAAPHSSTKSLYPTSYNFEDQSMADFTSLHDAVHLIKRWSWNPLTWWREKPIEPINYNHLYSQPKWPAIVQTLKDQNRAEPLRKEIRRFIRQHLETIDTGPPEGLPVVQGYTTEEIQAMYAHEVRNNYWDFVPRPSKGLQRSAGTRGGVSMQ